MTALEHTKRPSLVFADALGNDTDDVVDLRALDTPVSDVSLKNAVRVAWQSSPRLTVRVDGTPSTRVLALLRELVRRELRWGPDDVERFGDDHRVIAKTDAARPSEALLALFPVRVRSAHERDGGRDAR